VDEAAFLQNVEQVDLDGHTVSWRWNAQEDRLPVHVRLKRTGLRESPYRCEVR
jgi:hypothetical protein